MILSRKDFLNEVDRYYNSQVLDLISKKIDNELPEEHWFSALQEVIVNVHEQDSLGKVQRDRITNS